MPIRTTIAISIVLIVVIAVSVVWFFAGSSMPEGHRVSVYYFNTGTFRLESIEHSLPYGDEHMWPDTIVALFVNNSRIPSFTGVWADGTGFLSDWSLDGDVFEAVFPKEYYDIPSLEEALFRAAFVWTVTELPFINQVYIRVEGDEERPLVAESRETVAINPVISSVRLTTRTFTLYYINETLDALVPVARTSDNVDMDQVEKYILTLLIDGPEQEGLVATIPPETRIVDIVLQESTCYVNLTSDFISRFNGNASLARLTVYSIVNSLTENMAHVRRVQFLIDSERVDQFHGMTDFHQMFERDETLILGHGG